jgi:hypothetical protein
MDLLQWTGMPLRLQQLFVKKRGRRRTGARWLGALGEALLDLAMLLIGLAGIYWLIAQVLWAEGGASGWWPWLALVVPAVLVVYGLVGVVVLIWENLISSERRAAVMQRATDWELPGADAERHRFALPAVPSIDAVIDSPGVTLRYRLPIDAAPGQLSVALAAVCVVWNSLAAGFVVRVVRQHLDGQPNWLLTWLVVPFVLAGAWTIYAFVRQIVLTTGIGPTLVELSDHPLHPNRTYEALVSQSGRLFVRWFQVHLVCEEIAMYQQGTDTRTARAIAHREPVFTARRFDISSGEPFVARFSLAVPAGAMHSFEAAHNGVNWALVVRGRMARWPEFERRFPLYVYPPPAGGDAAGQRHVAAGVAR